MPRLGSISSIPLTGIGISVPVINAGAVYERVTSTTITLGTGVTQSASIKKFGTSSLQFDGTGSIGWSNTGGTGLLSYNGANGYTIETWVNLNTTAAGNKSMFYLAGSSPTNQYITNFHAVPGDGTQFDIYAGGPSLAVEPTILMGTTMYNTWVWLVIQFKGQELYVWVNGTQVSASTTGIYNAGATQTNQKTSLTVGSSFFGGWKGYMDDFRVSSGYRYSSGSTSITVPSSKISADGTTLVLIQT